MDEVLDQSKSISFIGEEKQGEYLELAGKIQENSENIRLLGTEPVAARTRTSFTLKKKVGLIVGSLLFAILLLFFRIEDEKFKKVPEMLACLVMMITFWILRLKYDARSKAFDFSLD